MEQKIKYNVIVMKKAQDHIFMIETENYDEAYKVWKETKDKWTNAIKEQIPFELESPIVTAFDPGMIYEITLVPIEAATNVNSNNPYKRNAQAKGFSNTFGANGMLDQGYQR